MATHCRPAQAEDIDDLDVLMQSVMRAGMPFSKRQEIIFRRLLQEETVDLLVVEKDEYIVACCHCAVIPTLFHSGRPYAVLNHFVVDPLNRRQGKARLLLTYALGYVQKKGCYKVYLPVDKPKDWYAGFLASLGAHQQDDWFVFGGKSFT